MKENNYSIIAHAIDSLIAKHGSEKIAALLSSLNSAERMGAINSYLLFMASSIYNEKMEDVEKSEKRNCSEARMIIFHLLHREYGASIGAIGSMYNALKGAVHRFVSNMDEYLAKPQYHRDLVENYTKIQKGASSIFPVIKTIKK